MSMYTPITEPRFFSSITEVQQMLLPKFVFLKSFLSSFTKSVIDIQ